MRMPPVAIRGLLALAMAAATSKLGASIVVGPPCISGDTFTNYASLTNGCSS